MTKIVGIPTETKTNEARVALTPQDCKVLVEQGCTLHLQAGAGEKAGYPDALYEKIGVVIQSDATALYAGADIIVKVKEPQAGDLELLEERHTLFCYLHLAAEPALVEALKKIGLKAIAFETVVVEGQTPLLAPMSAIAGRLAVQIGTWQLHAPRGGRGVLVGGIQGHVAGRVTVVGAGVAGCEAATLAHGMGANVMVLDIQEEKLQSLQKALPGIQTKLSSPETLEEVLQETDLLVGAVYVMGQRAPQVITEKMIAGMPKGAVAVDISIDQGGCMETAKPCTHDAPVYEAHGILHSAITNLPAAAPHTASELLSKAITPYVAMLAKGEVSTVLEEAVNVDAGTLKLAL